MIATFDTETRGFEGDIFRVGFYDGNIYHTFYNGIDFLDFLTYYMESKESKEMLNLYAFNMEFDLGKLMKEAKINKYPLKIDFKKSLVINGKFHVAKLKDINVYMRDIYPLVSSSLEAAAKSFELDTKKLEIKGRREDYFKTVDADDPELLQYLENDVKATYDLVYKIWELSELELEDFTKCITAASLSMRIFKTKYLTSYKTIKDSWLTKDSEALVREAYHGGRVEIYKNKLENGYHYDINSLYPYVMEKYPYPVGNQTHVRQEVFSSEEMMECYEYIKESVKNLVYIMRAKVYVPDLNIPPLPLKGKNLVFPVGTFTGVFCSPELEYAIKYCNCQILEIYELVYWDTTEHVFADFVRQQKELKLNSYGAKKNFSKIVQNSLYGKLGMKRERLTYTENSDKKLQKLEEDGKDYCEINTIFGDMLCYERTFIADYIRPQFAALITSYARLELLMTMHELEKSGNMVYYCDTDSVICQLPFPGNLVDRKEYGKWKLENEVVKGIFILPKLYAEIDKEGKEILKSKGIVKEHMQKTTFADYETFYQKMVNRENYTVYDYEAGYVQIRKLVQSFKQGKEIQELVKLRKMFLFDGIEHKRIYDFTNNCSIPVKLTES